MPGQQIRRKLTQRLKQKETLVIQVRRKIQLNLLVHMLVVCVICGQSIGAYAKDERAEKICKRQYESRSFAKALKNCALAGEAGDAISYVRMGFILRNGVPTLGAGYVKYPKRAYAAFVRAAEMGSVQAHNLVAEMLEAGEGIAKNLEQADEWRERALALSTRQATTESKATKE